MIPDSRNPEAIAAETRDCAEETSRHSTARMNGSNRKTRSEGGESPPERRTGTAGKRMSTTESGSAGSWVMKSHEPPRAFFFGFDGGEGEGWERIEIRPEHELVVK